MGRIRNAKSGHIKKKLVNHVHGYLSIRVYFRGKNRSCRTTTLIAAAWLPPKPGPEYEVDHINNDKTDERVENLRWLTKADNIKKSYDEGGHPYRASNIPRLTEKTYDEIKALWKSGMSQVQIAKKYHVHNSHVSRIVRGKVNPPINLPRDPRAIKRRARDILRNNPNLGCRLLGKLLDVSKDYAHRLIKSIKKEKEEKTAEVATNGLS